MRKLYILCVIALASLIIGLAWAEQITLTTYYPAPHGVYDNMAVLGLNIYANNAAATGGGLTVGAFYRTGADPDQVCVVH